MSAKRKPQPVAQARPVPFQHGHRMVGTPNASYRVWGPLLAGILLLAAVLRLANLGQSPPGLNQDEAANAWNAWCLLKTGQDQSGERWPIFASRCMGEYRSPLFLYYLLPFLAVGGLSIWTIRFAAAVAGIAAVALAYYVGARMLNRPVGLLAAGVMALAPWAIEQSRWAHEATLVPALLLGTIALVLLARLPIADPSTEKGTPNAIGVPAAMKGGGGPLARVWGPQPRPAPALLAGLFAGVSCYGYPNVRLFLPLALTAMALVNARGWWRTLKTRRGLATVAVFVLGIAVTFGPLAWKHLTDPQIGKRGTMTWVWDKRDSALTKLGKVVERYPGHFGPDFLFRTGDLYPVHHAPGWGQLHWYLLPPMLAGAVFVVARLPRSPSARTLAAWLLLYPIGDCLSRHPSLHALRSLPGLPALALLSAVGTVLGLQWLWRFFRPLAQLAGAALVVAVVWLTVAHVNDYLGKPRDWQFSVMMHDDYVRACEWLKPKLDNADAVFNTMIGTNQAYLVSLVALGYPPEQWFKDAKEIDTSGPWDLCLRYGKMHFMYFPQRVPEQVAQLVREGKTRLVFIVRPGELRDLLGADRPAEIIRDTDGHPTLLIFEKSLSDLVGVPNPDTSGEASKRDESRLEPRLGAPPSPSHRAWRPPHFQAASSSFRASPSVSHPQPTYVPFQPNSLTKASIIAGGLPRTWAALPDSYTGRQITSHQCGSAQCACGLPAPGTHCTASRLGTSSSITFRWRMQSGPSRWYSEKSARAHCRSMCGQTNSANMSGEIIAAKSHWVLSVLPGPQIWKAMKALPPRSSLTSSYSGSNACQ